jgi:hypothetical protein
MLHSVFSHLLAARKKPATPLASRVFLRVPGNFESVLSEGNENRGRDRACLDRKLRGRDHVLLERSSSSELEKSCSPFLPEVFMACQRCSVA